MKSGAIRKPASRKTSSAAAAKSSLSKSSRKRPAKKARALSNAKSASAKKAVTDPVRRSERQGQTEDEMNRYRRLEAVGALAEDIAHDFNNILTAIMHNVYAAKMFLEKETKRDEVPNLLDDCMKTIRRATSLAHQLLAFSAEDEPFRKSTHLENVIMDSANSSLIGTGVECEFRINDHLWPAFVDEGKIAQVISNLVINEKQVITGGGKIDVAADNVVIGKGDALPLKNGKYVKLSVKGMSFEIPEKHMKKILDPCFSAKGRGSCLYLAASYSIVKKQGGLITVESEEGPGTTFHVYLPVSEKVTETDSLTPS